jgi:CheY-like chemotaxis protein
MAAADPASRPLVLVVEDEQGTREMMTRVFERHQYSETVANGERAVRRDARLKGSLDVSLAPPRISTAMPHRVHAGIVT